jgi:Flp pilus assembly protein TadG
VGLIFRLRMLSDDLGQSMVELALLLPVLVFGLIGAADLARAYALQLAVQNGARAGAEAYAIDFAKNAAQAVQRSKDEMGRTPGLVCDAAHACTVAITIAQADGTTCTVSPPTIDNPCFVTVRVKYTFKTIIPWPIIPNTANFDRSTVMRLFY